MKYMKLLLCLVLALCSVGCTMSPATKEDVASVQQAVTPITVSLWATHLLAPPPVGFTGLFTITEDASHPTPNLVRLQFSPNVALPQLYNTTFKNAVGQLGPPNWTGMTNALTLAQQRAWWLKIFITYDDSVAGASKPWSVFGYTLCSGVGLAFGPGCG